MLLASWFGAGLLALRAGHVGFALAALPCGWVVAWFGGAGGAERSGAVIVFRGRVLCVRQRERRVAPWQKDPGWVVIDEVAAVWAVLGPLDFWVGAAPTGAVTGCGLSFFSGSSTS